MIIFLPQKEELVKPRHKNNKPSGAIRLVPYTKRPNVKVIPVEEVPGGEDEIIAFMRSKDGKKIEVFFGVLRPEGDVYVLIRGFPPQYREKVQQLQSILEHVL